MLKIADTSLSPAEKDDRQIERLINKKSAPSRKPSSDGTKKHDNRRRVMKDHSEKRDDDKDLSRQTQSSLFVIAARVAADGDIFDAFNDTLPSAQAPKKSEPEKSAPEKTEPAAPKKKLTEEEKVNSGAEVDTAQEGKDLIEKLHIEIAKSSDELGKQFKEFALQKYGPILDTKIGELGGALKQGKDLIKKQKITVEKLTKLLEIFHKLSKTPFSGDPGSIAAKIASIWPNGKPDDTVTRGGIITAVKNSMDKIKVPASLKAVMKKEPGSTKNNAKLIEEALREAIKDDKHPNDNEISTFAMLTAAYRVLLKNPDTIDVNTLISQVDEQTDRIHAEIDKLLVLPKFMKSWENAIKEFSNTDTEDKKISAYDYYGEVSKTLKTFFKKGEDEPPFNPDSFVDGLESVLGKKYSEAPEELKKMVEGYRGKTKSAATSYDATYIKAMHRRQATYHGVLQQGDPTHGPYTGYRSLDRRYFGKEHYDSIIKTAKAFLKEDWLKYEWDGGSKDASSRAALDLSIWTADSSMYQAKIDTETYNMLLARLMGLKDEVFSDTLITTDDSVQSRRASSMSNQHYQNILRIASGLRKTDPRAAFELVKNLRSFVAQEEPQDEEQAAPPAPPAAQGQEQEEEQEQVVPPPAPPAAQGQQQMMGQQQQQGQQEQQGAGAVKTAPIADWDDNQIHKFLESMKTQAGKFLSEHDIAEFMDGVEEKFDEMSESGEEEGKGKEKEKVAFSVASLVRIAFANPGARPALLGMIREAAKKKEKKKEKKKSKKAPKKESKNPFADKKAPPGKGGKKAPFGGKKAPPFGKKKSSVSIDLSDTDW